MDFRIWWEFYHVYSILYPNCQSFKGFIFDGLDHLSCLKCTHDAKSYLNRHRWTSSTVILYKLHNNINIRLHKKTISWQEAMNLYSFYNPLELFDLQWKFIMMIFKVSLNHNKLIYFFDKFLKFFGHNISYNPQSLLSEQRQFHLYIIYVNLGGLKPFEEMVYFK